jgi:hypothetical protein
MGTCESCVHYRRPRPPSEALSATIRSQSSEVSKVLGAIQDDERKVFEAELESKRTLISAGRESWMGRPVMSAFCGIREDRGSFLLSELKNADGQCSEWKDADKAPAAAHACATCLHRREATGPAEDSARESRILEISSRDTSARVQSSPAPGILTGHRDNVAVRQANEVRAAYYGAGSLAADARYLDTCARLSRPGSSVVCAIENRWSTCGVWEPSAGAAEAPPPQPQEGSIMTEPSAGEREASSAPGAAPAAEPVPAPDATSAAPTLVTSVPGPTDVPAALAESVSAMLTAPATAGVNGTAAPPAAPSGLLAPGLERRMLDRIVAAYEWLLGIRLSPPQREQFSQTIIADVGARGAAGLAEYQQAVMLQDRVPPTDEIALAALREQVQPQAVWTLRQMTDATAIMLVAAYDAANPAIAQGVPPLTPEMADCYLSLLMTVQGYRSGQRRLASDAERVQFTQQLAAAYPTFGLNVQSWFATLPAGWTAMALQLRSLPPEQQAALVSQIDATVQALGLLRPPAAPPPPAATAATSAYAAPTPAAPAYGAPAPTYAAPPPAYGAPPPAYAAPASPAPEPGSVDAAIADMMADDDRRLAELRKTDPGLALQEQAANSARYATILSNISQMRHQTAMTIAGNIK